MVGKEFSSVWVLDGVGFAQLGMSALSTLGNDFGDWRLASSFLKAVDGGLLPALFGFWLAGLRWAIILDVFIL